MEIVVVDNKKIKIETNNEKFKGHYELYLWTYQTDMTGKVVYRANYTNLSIIIGGDVAHCQRDDWRGNYEPEHHVKISSYYATSYRPSSYYQYSQANYYYIPANDTISSYYNYFQPSYTSYHVQNYYRYQLYNDMTAAF